MNKQPELIQKNYGTKEKPMWMLVNVAEAKKFSEWLAKQPSFFALMMQQLEENGFIN